MIALHTHHTHVSLLVNNKCMGNYDPRVPKEVVLYSHLLILGLLCNWAMVWPRHCFFSPVDFGMLLGHLAQEQE